ncbi:MAG: CTP synthase [Candidatus Pacebacteria bacterium]|nr:CTP synthase [Candidatus Paceibacterota bacterium]MBP9866593.1 CTP synthase [Candidatus Paceibacterota bacterium]
MVKNTQSPKYIFVVGGVISGVGKGITASSIAKILQNRGQIVTSIKIDPYVNVDAGTMNPTEHGEVFVLDDGYETDQDMGNYERFLNITLPSDNYMTTGRVYQSVIEKERSMFYKGNCVQVVPHVPMEVITRIKTAQKKTNADVVVIEIGGTVGEYENILFLEAARMMKTEKPNDVACVVVSYLPIPFAVGEMKTKPTQHAVRTLQSSGLWPDMIIARSALPLDDKRKEKLAFFCNVKKEHIISAPDVKSIYDVPVNFEKEHVGDIISEILGINTGTVSVEKKALGEQSKKDWELFVKRANTVKNEIKIAIVGKYFDTGDFVLSDAYLSVIEAIKHASYAQNKKPIITWVNSGDFEISDTQKHSDVVKKLKSLNDYDGVLVPGGFGSRGIQGKIEAIKYVREHKIPYLGLCYGMQLAVIEFAQHVVGIAGATSKELDEHAKDQVITIMESQKETIKHAKYGGSMRLGAYDAKLKKGSLVAGLYNSLHVSERHRHRYEVNNKYVSELEKAGLVFSGTSPDGSLMEYIELPKKVHPFFVGTQAHPEFKSHPTSPHPLFIGFIQASSKKRN